MNKEDKLPELLISLNVSKNNTELDNLKLIKEYHNELYRYYITYVDYCRPELTDEQREQYAVEALKEVNKILYNLPTVAINKNITDVVYDNVKMLIQAESKSYESLHDVLIASTKKTVLELRHYLQKSNKFFTTEWFTAQHSKWPSIYARETIKVDKHYLLVLDKH